MNFQRASQALWDSKIETATVGYVCRWKVEKEYGLTQPQSDKLLAALCRTAGAVAEHPVWSGILPPELDPGFDTLEAILSARPILLLEVMDDPRDEDGMIEDGIFPDSLLQTAIRQIYEGERQPEELAIFANFFSVRRHEFYTRRLEAFTALYHDSLLLRQADVQAYCREREAKGLTKAVVDSILAGQGHPPPERDRPPADETPPVQSGIIPLCENQGAASNPATDKQPFYLEDKIYKGRDEIIVAFKNHGRPVKWTQISVYKREQGLSIIYNRRTPTLTRSELLRFLEP